MERACSGYPVRDQARGDVIGALGWGDDSTRRKLTAGVAVCAVTTSQRETGWTPSGGRIMKARLVQMQERCPYVGDVRGQGLVMGVELVKDKASKEPAPDLTVKLIDRAARNGLLIGSVGIFGSVIRVAPPLVITEAEAHESLDIFEKSLSEL
jgi:4-aminobutyrate aminotransferase-like enzyme